MYRPLPGIRTNRHTINKCHGTNNREHSGLVQPNYGMEQPLEHHELFEPWLSLCLQTLRPISITYDSHAQARAKTEEGIMDGLWKMEHASHALILAACDELSCINLAAYWPPPILLD